MIDLLNEDLNVEKSLKGHTSLKSREGKGGRGGGATGHSQIIYNLNMLTQGFSKFLDRDPF
jgi:hypothetical protein